MYASVQQSLVAVFDRLSPVLVPASTRKRLLEFAARHPALGQTQYLECRLGQQGLSQVDLLASAGTTFDRETLGRVLAGPGVPPEFWPINRFVEAWSSPSSRLHTGVPVAWLEFDHMERDPDPIANVGVCVAPAYLDPFASLPPQPAAEVLATILHTLRAIRRHEVTAEEHACFERCIERLPPTARWIHLSIMAARSPTELKLYGAFPVHAVVPYLRDIGWAGDCQPVADLLDRYCPPERTGDVVYLDLPVTGMCALETAGAGIVFAQQQLRTERDGDPGRRGLLEALVEDGLCRTEERDALVGWPGRDLRLMPQGGPGEGELAWVDRWFDIKVVHRPSGPPLAKAYLGFTARTTTIDELSRAAPGSPRPAASPGPVAAPGTS